MSDILIKGMEMPKGCDECPMSQLVNDNLYAYCHLLMRGIKRGYKRVDCPLVEVKEHGRLVDADEFITELRTTINKVLLGSLLHNIFVNDEAVKQDTLDGINFVLNRLENEAPTVLEAST